MFLHDPMFVREIPVVRISTGMLWEGGFVANGKALMLRSRSHRGSGWSHRLAWPRTEPSQGLNTGSNPVGTTTDPFGAGGAVDVPLFSLRFVNPAVSERPPRRAREKFSAARTKVIIT